MALIGTSTIVFPKLDASKDSSAAKRKHVCKICSRAFKRSEHCIRHQRGHTQEKPFGCRVCRRRYSRRDLLVRHERTLHTAEQLALAIEQQARGDSKSPEFASAKSSPSGHSAVGEGGNDDFVFVQNDLPLPSLEAAAISSPSAASSSQGQKRPSTADVDQARKVRVTSRSFSHHPETADTMIVSELPSRTMGNPTPSIDPPSTMGLHIADFSLDISDLDKMRTFPSSVPLPDLDGDLEFLDFFDPFLGLPPKQIEAMALPPLIGNGDGWSPLENFSVSSQASIQDYGFQQVHAPPAHESLMAGDARTPVEVAKPSLTHLEQGLPPWNGNSPQQNPGPDVGDACSPQLRQPVSTKPPPLTLTDDMRTSLLKDLSNRLPADQLSTFRLPTAAALQKCIRTYVDAFHVHFPIFHLQTIDFARTPSPLVLAICAIGALYRLERRTAASLYVKADQALTAAVDRGGHLYKKPRLLEDWIRPGFESPTSSYQETFWTSQTRLLLAMFSCFSGDTEVISKSIVRLGDFLIDYRQLAPEVKPPRGSLESLSWEAWIERESVKRLLYGHIMFGNLVTMTYGIPPGYSIVSDGYIEMPCDQSLWDASTEADWQEAAARRGKSSPLSIRDAVSRVMYDNTVMKPVPEECWVWSPFAVSVAINVIWIQIWHITQGSFFSTGIPAAPASSGMPHDSQKSQLLTQTEAALSRCRALITQARSDADYAWTDAEGPLLFNCLALLRVSYCRAFTGIGATDSLILLKDGHKELMASIEDFVAMPQDRSDLVARAVSRAFEGMLIPYKSGTLLIKKTAALTWSVGHALAGFDAALLVTKWVHALEVNADHEIPPRSPLEAQTMDTIRNLLSDLEDPPDGGEGNVVSLAAKLARHWAGFYDDTWVWGVTPRMGWVMRELANCFESNRGWKPVP